MNWISFTEQLPEDNQWIIQWNRQDVYEGDKKVMVRTEDAPFVTRFIREDWEKQLDEGREPDLSIRGFDIYFFMVCWLPVPTLPSEYRKGDFVDEDIKRTK